VAEMLKDILPLQKLLRLTEKGCRMLLKK